MMRHFDAFLQSGLYLRGWSSRTPPIYRRAFASFSADAPVTRATLDQWVIRLRQRGLSPASCNIYIRAMNAFCTWATEEGIVKGPLKLKLLKAPSKPITVFSPVEIAALLAHKPKRRTYLRTWIMIVLMLDTGCRIDEVLTLHTSAIDFDNLLLTVRGKGDKTRRIPFSPEMRKHLWKYCQTGGAVVFATRNGTPISYRNAYRGMKACCRLLGIEGRHVHPHNLRHTFACTFVQRGGDIFTLSRILGHSSVTTTQVYLRGLQVEQLTHHSPLCAR